MGNSILEMLQYTEVKGARSDHEIILYSLSTCGFCKRAMAWLEDRGIQYRYVFLDNIPLETKKDAKRILKERFADTVAFPFTVVDQTNHLVGFVESEWQKLIE